MRKSSGYIVLTLIFQEEDDVWTAECKELGTAAFGDTLAEAREAIEEAVTMHLNGLEIHGELARFFRENGIQVRTSAPKSSIPPRINLPVNAFVQRKVLKVQRAAVA